MAEVFAERLAASAATAEFREALAAFGLGQPQDRLTVRGDAPLIKVQRVLTKLFEELPEHPIERVTIEARSGCSNYTGRLRVEPGGIEYEFDWDCEWKARQVGYVLLGWANQRRAAEEFGYDCFRVFSRVA